MKNTPGKTISSDIFTSHMKYMVMQKNPADTPGSAQIENPLNTIGMLSRIPDTLRSSASLRSNALELSFLLSFNTVQTHLQFARHSTAGFFGE